MFAMKVEKQEVLVNIQFRSVLLSRNWNRTNDTMYWL